MPQLTVTTTIAAPLAQVWHCYTAPQHITQWNYAHPSWHCPTASNDMRIGGLYSASMQAVDGSSGFVLQATYTHIVPLQAFTYVLADGREVTTTFANTNENTTVTTTFDAETENTLELQQQGWQMILNNFAAYVLAQ